MRPPTESESFYLVDVVNFWFSFCLQQLFSIIWMKITPTSFSLTDNELNYFHIFPILFDLHGSSSSEFFNMVKDHCGNMCRYAKFPGFTVRICIFFYFLNETKQRVQNCVSRNWTDSVAKNIVIYWNKKLKDRFSPLLSFFRIALLMTIKPQNKKCSFCHLYSCGCSMSKQYSWMSEINTLHFYCQFFFIILKYILRQTIFFSANRLCYVSFKFELFQFSSSSIGIDKGKILFNQKRFHRWIVCSRHIGTETYRTESNIVQMIQFFFLILINRSSYTFTNELCTSSDKTGSNLVYTEKW